MHSYKFRPIHTNLPIRNIVILDCIACTQCIDAAYCLSVCLSVYVLVTLEGYAKRLSRLRCRLEC